MERDGASVEFIKKMNQSGSETEACNECAASMICKLKDQLHKASIPGRETFITACDFLIERGYQD